MTSSELLYQASVSPYKEKIERLITMVEDLQEAVKEAYFEGWQTGRMSTSVDGDPTLDWNESYAKEQVDDRDND